MAKAETDVRSHLLKVLDSQSSDCSPDALRAVDRVCVEFETAWTSETPVTIESLLQRSPKLDQGFMLRHLLPVELELRTIGGETVAAESLKQRFPDHPDVIAAVLSEQNSGQQAGNHTIAAGGETSFACRSQPQTPRIPGYRITGRLGQGGMGVVYRAVQLRLNREVALKVISASPHSSDKRQSQFLQEGEIVASLSHPGIAHVYDAGEADGVPYLASELVTGGTIADVPLPLPHNQAVELVASITNALAVAHQHGIVHRDLKPSNILLADVESGVRVGDRTVQPKITDFGLASRGAAGDQLSGICGTPDYMAPEQTESESDANGQTVDIHSMGVLLYELLTGVNPYRGKTIATTIDNVKHLEAPVPSTLVGSIPSPLDEIVRTCLHKTPTQRYASADELVTALSPPPKAQVTLPRGMLLATIVCACVVMSGFISGAFPSGFERERQRPGSVAAVRELAHRFIRHGGKLQLEDSDEWITEASELPAGPLEISVLRTHQRSFLDESDLATIGQHQSLRELYLSYQFFPDDGEEHLGNLTELTLLDLFYCRLNEQQLARFLPRLTQLRTLVIGQTNLPPGALRHAAECRQLEHLVLSQNMVASLDAARLVRQFPKLRRITFYGVHDSGLVNLAASSPPVDHITIYWGQKLSDTGIRALADLPVLRQLTIRTSNLLDADLRLLATAPRLQALRLHDNRPDGLDLESIKEALPGVNVKTRFRRQAD